MATRKEAGFSLIGMLVLGVAVVGLSLTVFSIFRQSKKSLDQSQHQIVAQALATELGEFFRSMNNDLAIAYLRANPYSGGQPAYRFCQNINEFSPSTRTVSRPDSLALLGQAAVPSAMRDLNRYYRIEVVDRLTLAINTSACNETALTFVRTANESLIVTVGVRWTTQSSTGANEPHEFTLNVPLVN